MRILFLTLIFLSLAVNSTAQENIVKIINEDQLRTLVQNRNGKLLLINVWATWCIPCREEFLDLVKLDAKFKDKIDIVGISIDFEDEIESKIMPFLKSNKVKFSIYINGFQKDEELINFLNNNWNGAIPSTFIYNLEGKQIIMIEGKKDYSFFESSIKAVLK